MKTTFVDSGVLIAVAKGEDDVYEQAMAVLDDPEREFVSSVYVKLETLPIPVWSRREAQVELYESFFDGVSRWVPSSPELSERALEVASEHGLGAVDALLVAAAETEGAELVTKEKPTKPMFQVASITVTSIHQ